MRRRPHMEGSAVESIAPIHRACKLLDLAQPEDGSFSSLAFALPKGQKG